MRGVARVLAHASQITRGKEELPKRVVRRAPYEQLLALLETRSAYYDGFVEGAYLRVDDEDGRHNAHRSKIVRPDFIQGITSHWSSHTLVKNGLLAYGSVAVDCTTPLVSFQIYV